MFEVVVTDCLYLCCSRNGDHEKAEVLTTAPNEAVPEAAEVLITAPVDTVPDEGEVLITSPVGAVPEENSTADGVESETVSETPTNATPDETTAEKLVIYSS